MQTEFPMQPIAQSVPAFLDALQSPGSIRITADGKWCRKGFLEKITESFRRKLFGYDGTIDNAKNLAKFLTTSSSIREAQAIGIAQGTGWKSNDLQAVISAVKGTLKTMAEKEERDISLLTKKRNTLLAALDLVLPQTPIIELNKRIFDPECWPYRMAVVNLDRAWMTFRYLGMDQRTIDVTEPKAEDLKWVEGELAAWQDQQFPCVKYVGGTNHDKILEKIHHCCRYQEFIAAAREERALLDLLFKSAFKSLPDDFTHAIDVFLQVPSLQDQLRRTYLDKRIRDIANQGLQFEQRPETSSAGKPIKDVKLLIDGEYQSITNVNRMVRVAKGIQKTVAQVFDEFEAQNFRFTEMEYLQETGVTMFDGRLLTVDLEHNTKEWWKQLPVIRKLTREQIEETYGVSFKEGYALFLIRASRSTPDLNAIDNHGWSNIIYPLEDGTFNVIAPGKFSDRFPVSTWEKFRFIFRTHRASLTLLDTNEFMSSRDRIAVPMPTIGTKEEFETIMEDLRKELIKSKNGELVFQFQGDNCASWVRQFMQHNWPELKIEPFLTPFQDVYVPFPIMPIISARQWLPNEWTWQHFRRIICSLLGAASGHTASDGKGGTRTVRLINNREWHTGILNLPARLWIEQGKIAKKVSEYTGLLSARSA